MFGRGGGVRSVTFLKWSMMRDVTVAGPRKEVVRVASKIAVRRRFHKNRIERIESLRTNEPTGILLS